jgi:hypothetical protein
MDEERRTTWREGIEAERRERLKEFERARTEESGGDEGSRLEGVPDSEPENNSRHGAKGSHRMSQSDGRTSAKLVDIH